VFHNSGGKSEIRGYRKRKQPAKGLYTENKRVHMKKKCTLARGIKAKSCETNGRKTKASCNNIIW
jgi:hypothetical protein